MARTLIGGGLGDGLDRQALHLGASVETRDPPVPVSMTAWMPGTVSEVSATLVERTMRRPVCDWKIAVVRGGEASVERRISTSSRFLARCSCASRISRSPGRSRECRPVFLGARCGPPARFLEHRGPASGSSGLPSG